MQKISNSTENGKVFICSKCDAIHIEFKNLNFNFSETQFKNFTDYILELNGSEWEYKNRNTHYRRKIIIPTGHKNVKILLNNGELTELKQLLSISKPCLIISENINTLKLNFTNFLN